MSVRAVVFIGGTVLAGIATLSFIGGSFYTVDQGERAVVTNLGRVIGVADPGFHWKVPFTQSAHDIPVRTTLSTWENMASYSRDQQPAELKISIAWRADSGRVEEIYTEYRDLESMASRVLAPRATQAIKVVFGRFNAATSISGAKAARAAPGLIFVCHQYALACRVILLTLIAFTGGGRVTATAHAHAAVEAVVGAVASTAASTASKAHAFADSGVRAAAASSAARTVRVHTCADSGASSPSAHLSSQLSC